MHRPGIDDKGRLNGADTVLGGPRLDARRAISLWFVGLVGLYLLLFLIQTFKNSSLLLRDPDVYWHVAVGRMIWQTKAVPHIDQLSHTFSGHAWIARDWLSEFLLFGAYTLASWRGVALLTASIAALAYALLFLVLARSMRVSVAFCVSVAAFLFSIGHFNARPQVFADPLIVIWIAGLVSAVEDKQSPNPLLIPIMVLWANLHASFTFGLAMVGLLGIEAFFDCSAQERFGIAKRWGIFLIVALGAACLTPYGFKPFLVTFKVLSNESAQYTVEWQPTTFQIGSMYGGFYGPTFLALIFLALYNGVKLPFWRLSAFMLVLYLMFAHLRFVSLFAIVAPILLAAPLLRQFSALRLSKQIDTDPAFFETMTRVSKSSLYLISSAIVGAMLAFGAYGRTMVPRAEVAPAGAVDYIYDHRLVGNIYNHFNFGGYLVFRGIKTFVDGRTDQLFVDNFFNSLMEVVNRNPDHFVSYLKQYQVTLAVVIPGSVEARELERSPDWAKIYSDSVSDLFQRDAFDPAGKRQ
jgi:hypothetical protein